MSGGDESGTGQDNGVKQELEEPASSTTTSAPLPVVTSVDHTRLWTLRIVRGDDHHLVVPIQVFPDASVWELKVILSLAVHVDPDQITLHCGGHLLAGGLSLTHLSRKGLKDLATVFMTRETAKKRRMVVRGGLDTATLVSQASAGIVLAAPVTPITTAQNHQSYSTDAALAHVAQLPTRKFLSKQLVETIILMASHPKGILEASCSHQPCLPPQEQPGDPQRAAKSTSGGKSSSSLATGGGAFRYFEERVALGENIASSIDAETGYNVLQLAILHARNPSMALLLLRRNYQEQLALLSTNESSSSLAGGGGVGMNLRFQRRYPESPLEFDSNSEPLLLCCDLMLDSAFLPPTVDSATSSGLGLNLSPSRRTATTTTRKSAVESALVFCKVLPALIEQLKSNLPVLLQNSKISSRLKTAVDTLRVKYFVDDEFGTEQDRKAISKVEEMLLSR